MVPDFWRDKFVKKPKGTPCPALVWFLIDRPNDPPDGLIIQHLRTIVRSPTPFKLKNPNLKHALERLGLEWLTPSQISRIRECPAPSYKVIHDRYDRWLSRYSPRNLEQAPRCRKFFWAWRGDQKTCDEHLEYAAMFRVQKHRKVKQKRRDNLLQLKNARAELKRARRKRRREKRQAERLAQAAVRPATPSQLQAQKDRADLQLLKWIRVGYEVEAKDSDRLEAMIRNGYVVPDEAESETYKLSGQGLRLLAELRKRVGRGPALT
jgi:hypothetical protein